MVGGIRCRFTETYRYINQNTNFLLQRQTCTNIQIRVSNISLYVWIIQLWITLRGRPICFLNQHTSCYLTRSWWRDHLNQIWFNESKNADRSSWMVKTNRVSLTLKVTVDPEKKSTPRRLKVKVIFPVSRAVCTLLLFSLHSFWHWNIENVQIRRLTVLNWSVQMFKSLNLQYKNHWSHPAPPLYMKCTAALLMQTLSIMSNLVYP